MLSRRMLLFGATASCAGARGPCDNLSSRIRIAPENESGQRMVVTGRVVRPDGRTAAAGVTMYVYHTDHTGEYGGDRQSGPRLKGWLVTDSEGRYEYSTIRPAGYPGNRFAAHVHVQFWGNGVPPQFANDLLFDDDPLVRGPERERSRVLGEFGFVRTGELRGGVLHITHNFRLEAQGDRFEESVLHGRRACEV